MCCSILREVDKMRILKHEIDGKDIMFGLFIIALTLVFFIVEIVFL